MARTLSMKTKTETHPAASQRGKHTKVTFDYQKDSQTSRLIISFSSSETVSAEV